MKNNKSLTTPYVHFNRQQWNTLHNPVRCTLTKEQITNLKIIKKDLALEEITKIYLPLCVLLHFYFKYYIQHQCKLQQFLGKQLIHIPYIIGISGSVAVGKSTMARVLKVLLSHCTEHLKVEVLTTDVFLYTNKVLQNLGLMKKKGFPQSYDIQNLIKFVSEIKSGAPQVIAPQYSHVIYDIIPNSYKVITQPDILILEGLNILQRNMDYSHSGLYPIFISDFVDFSIYIDASEELLMDWYIHRFLICRKEALYNPDAYFYYYAQLTELETMEIAIKIWEEINGLNLKQNILPTREQASLIMTKGKNHVIENLYLRR
ncbi:type I pantothenate kinase [Candidatus Profftia sp. (ex Adelges kitamiensis)]|uniref:type I pantothenate kinase n=1 Tax=Candidatus Profftia sp. (ex Adelges kitamiensis) TaxID=2864218 RepID=UPI001CE3A7A0|nr:type I pantothenate kinase [Candidatus Profftia sp. (ex Adelges kitamiensis)]